MPPSSILYHIYKFKLTKTNIYTNIEQKKGKNMDKIEKYNQVIYEYETKYEKENLLLHKKCLQELILYNKEYKEKINNLYGDEEERFNTLHLEILKEKKDIIILYKILKKYNYNPAIAILWAITDICDTSYIKTEEYLINLYEASPYIEKIEKKENLFTLHSIIGTFTFQKIKEYLNSLNNERLITFYKKECNPGYCHFNTEKIVEAIKESIAITGLSAAAFKGYYYHSFSMYNEKCIDPNYSCVMDYKQYMELLKMIILNQITHNELRKENKDKIPFDFLLYKTLDKQIQKKK